jgi:metal-responsive CopG/Arc/MetJ family transcriptional regulator
MGTEALVQEGTYSATQEGYDTLTVATASISFDPALLRTLDQLVFDMKQSGQRDTSRSGLVNEAVRKLLAEKGILVGAGQERA